MKKVLGILFAMVCTSNLIFAQMDTLRVKTSAQCDQCKDRIETALAYEKGVKSSSVKVPGGLTTIIYNKTKTSPDKLRLVISKVGYDADNVAADAKAYEKLPACCRKPSDSKHTKH